MTTREQQRLLDYWEVSRLAFPGDPKQEGILIGAMAWIGLPTSIMEAILKAKTYDDAKTIIWRL